ncbi:MAG: hypothetical protein IJI47_00600 [Eubacterium sp.]|nr:hypothetical protein [Eubacterium sp.]
MKKLILSVLALLFLCGCTGEKTPPATITDTSFDAVYTTGDFSFNCNIKWQNNTAYITATSTNAAGLTISCNGREVTFTKGDMIKTEKRENIDNTNPAVLLWEVFTAMQNGGNHCTLGTFTVTQSEGEISRIAVNNIVIRNSEFGSRN